MTRTERCLSRKSIPICSKRAFPWVMTCLMCMSCRPSGVAMTPKSLYSNTLGISVCPHVKVPAGKACKNFRFAVSLVHVEGE